MEVTLIVESETRGQFHQHAYEQLLHLQIPKSQKDSQVISRKKVDQLVVLLYFSRFALYAVRSSLMKLTRTVKNRRYNKRAGTFLSWPPRLAFKLSATATGKEGLKDAFRKGKCG